MNWHTNVERVNEEEKSITDVEVKERISEWLIAQADEVLNIGLTADKIIERLNEGKIYKAEKND